LFVSGFLIAVPKGGFPDFFVGVDDPLSFQVSVDVGKFLDEYDVKLDIIYDDELILDDRYLKYVFLEWNSGFRFVGACLGDVVFTLLLL
jgi:hypothetical protein